MGDRRFLLLFKICGGSMQTGTLYGIGVGPGDSEFLTVKAVRTLEHVGVIIVPKTEKKTDSVAYQIAKPFIKESTEVIPIVFPMVLDMTVQERAWDENRKIISGLLAEGKDIAFLTLGDPMLYSTYMYIFRALKKTEYPIETIPGIPAFLAIASRIGRTVGDQEDVITILPGTADAEKLERVIAVSDSLVIMKVYKTWPIIKKLMEKYNLIDDAIMISRAGLPDEVVYRDLRALPEDTKLNYLSTILAKRSH